MIPSALEVLGSCYAMCAVLIGQGIVQTSKDVKRGSHGIGPNSTGCVIAFRGLPRTIGVRSRGTRTGISCSLDCLCHRTTSIDSSCWACWFVCDAHRSNIPRKYPKAQTVHIQHQIVHRRDIYMCESAKVILKANLVET
jgi:hypothetical protein